MSKRSVLFLLVLVYLSGTANSQVVTSKDHFKYVFVMLQNTSSSGFDKVPKDAKGIITDSLWALPQSTESKLYSGNYYATYKFNDSAKAAAFVTELKDLLDYSIRDFGIKVHYARPNESNPDYLSYYLADSNGFRDTDANVLIFNHEKKGSEVILGVGKNPVFGYFVDRQPRTNNAALTNFIKDLGFGADMKMKTAIGVKQRTDEGYIIYTSKKTIPGFRAWVYQPIENEESLQSGIALEKTVTGNSAFHKQQVDQLVMQLKAALPAGFYYYANEGSQTVTFLQLPYIETASTTVIRMNYGIDPKNKTKLTLQISIERVKE